MKNKAIILFMIILIVSLPTFLLFSSLHLAVDDLSFFEDKYKENNTTKVTGLSYDGLMEVTGELLDYLKGKRDNIDITANINGENRQVFGEREILHLKDVQLLFDKSYLFRNITAILSLAAIVYLFLYSKKALSKGLIYSSIIPIGIMVVLGAVISINFYHSFTIFHEILFTNDLWLLDPKTEVLIQMYPLNFFESMALRIFIYFMIGLMMSLGLGILLKSKTRYGK